MNAEAFSENHVKTEDSRSEYLCVDLRYLLWVIFIMGIHG